MFEIFEHTADLGLKIEAPTFDALLCEAARGLTSLLVANLDDVSTLLEKEIEVQGDAEDLLLFDWLNELLFIFETEHLLFREFEVQVFEIADGPAGHGRLRLSAVCHGEPMDREKHQMEHEVKAITYHGLQVQAIENRWLAEVIVDI